MEHPDQYVDIGGGRLLNRDVYKARMRLSIEPFLLEANERAGEIGKKAYVHATGIGLGVWKLSSIQSNLVVEAYYDAIRDNHLPHISDINFSWFRDISTNMTSSANDGSGNPIKIMFSLRNPSHQPLN